VGVNEGVVSSFGFSHDPSAQYWIMKLIQTVPELSNIVPTSEIIQYQKVALLHPDTLEYTIFHKVSVGPVNVEALATSYETNLAEKALRVYFFKDNEAG